MKKLWIFAPTIALLTCLTAGAAGPELAGHYVDGQNEQGRCSVAVTVQRGIGWLSYVRFDIFQDGQRLDAMTGPVAESNAKVLRASQISNGYLGASVTASIVLTENGTFDCVISHQGNRFTSKRTTHCRGVLRAR